MGPRSLKRGNSATAKRPRHLLLPWRFRAVVGNKVSQCMLRKPTCNHNLLVVKDHERSPDFSDHSAARSSYDEHRRRGAIGTAETLEAGVERVGCGPQVQNQDLIFPLEDSTAELTIELGVFSRVQLAEEHAVLSVVAICVERLEDLRASLVVRDVVGHEKSLSAHRSPCDDTLISRDVPTKPP